MKIKWLIVDILFIAYLMINPFLYIPSVHASSDEATWQNEADARGVWWGLPTGKVWAFLRFYPYGDEEFTMKIWRESNTSDMIALKFDAGTLCFWDRRNNGSWVSVGLYPEDEWLEAQLESTTIFGFYLWDAETDVRVLDPTDVWSDYEERLENRHELSLDHPFPGLNDVFEFELSFYNGSVALDYADLCSCQELFYWPVDRWVVEDFDDNDYGNWDTSTITCNSTYVIIGEMTIAKFWITGSEPSDPQEEDVDRSWWENWQYVAWQKFTDAWEQMSESLSNLPIIGDFASELWKWLDWGWNLLTSLWGIVVSNIPTISLLIVFGYVFGLLDAIRSCELNSIQDAIVSPVKMLMRLMNTIAGILQTIWSFIKFW